MKFRRTFCLILALLMMFSASASAEFIPDPKPETEKTETVLPAETESEAEMETEAAMPDEPSEESVAEPAVESGSEAEELPSESETEEADLPEWTVMLYFCGTDLESDGGFATTNLLEITETKPNSDVNVVLETGGCKEWHAQDLGLDIDENKTQRYHFDENGFTLDEELSLQNMANADTLTEFIQYSAENFPAQKYLLVLWDHGCGSLNGMIIDEQYDNAVMSLDQLERAVSRAGVVLEATLLDTCLMASLETAQALQGSCHYLIASEESVPGYGSDYYGWLQYLYDMPECSGKLFGRKVCDSAQQKYAELGFQYNGVTFSVIDLTQMDAVTKAFNRVFAELRQEVDDPTNMLLFSMATQRTESYGNAEMLDLGDLVERARGWGISKESCNEMLAALAEAVVYNVRGVDHSYSTGLSFWYAPSSRSSALDHYARSGKNADYLAFIDRVNTKWAAPSWVYDEVEYLPDITFENYGIRTATEITEDGQLQLTITNGLSAVRSIDLVLYSYEPDESSEEEDGESGTWTRLATDPYAMDSNFTTGVFTTNISCKLPTLNGQSCEMIVTAENEDYTLYKIPVELSDEGKMNLMVIYRYDTPITSAESLENISYEGSYEILGLQNSYNNTAIPSRNVYSIEDYIGSTIAPIFTNVFFPSGDKNGTVTTEGFPITSDLAITEEELPAGRYAAAYLITDVFGATTRTEMAPFNWDGTTVVFEGGEAAEEETAEEDLDADVPAEEDPAAEETVAEAADEAAEANPAEEESGETEAAMEESAEAEDTNTEAAPTKSVPNFLRINFRKE